MRRPDQSDTPSVPPVGNAPAEVPATGVPAVPAEESEADAGRTRLSDVTSTIVDAAQAGMSAARPVLQGVGDLAGEARRIFDERSGASVRNVRRMGRQPLLNLWDAHPEARRASIREIGLLTVPIEQIAGTAVEGGAQRGGDFLPLRDRRSDDWRARWQRILKGVEGLANLPPVELIRFDDRYWVVDGHNRVAAALYNGQVAIDAEVDDLRLPGVARDRTPTSIASVLESSSDVRQAGAGRLTRISSRPQRLPAKRAPDQGYPPRAAKADDEGSGEPGSTS